MSKLKPLFILVITLISYIGARAGVNEAAEAYKNGNYSEAVEQYKKIMATEGVSSSLYFNMGNAYLKAGDMGQAMLCYQRSLRLNPSNRQARANINYIASKVKDYNVGEAKGKKILPVEDPKSFLGNMRESITRNHLSNTWAVWAAVSFILFIGCVALYLFMNNVLARKIGFFAGGILFLICAVTLCFARFSANAALHDNMGVITGYKVSLYSEPFGTSHKIATPLARGTVMSVLDRDENAKGEIQWYKVRLNSDYVGWLPAEEFEPIVP